jgi:hypothetical protein
MGIDGGGGVGGGVGGRVGGGVGVDRHGRVTVLLGGDPVGQGAGLRLGAPLLGDDLG